MRILLWLLILQWLLIIFVMLLFIMCVVVRIIRHYWHFPIPGPLTRVIDNPIRRRFIQKPGLLAERMHLEPGMSVVEIGPGKGSYTLTIAERVAPEGRVFAVDIQEEVIERLKQRVEREGITNIEPMIDNAHSFSFEDESVDRIVAIACLPEIPDPVGVLRECRRILKLDGLVSLCELAIDPDYPRRKTTKRWAAEAGLELRHEYGSWFVYQLNFGKAPLPQSEGS